MKILSIDTASDVCGVSILEDKKSIISLDTNTGRTHSENLMPMIENAFNQTNLSLNDIELITCDIGPGSFTGLRIGIATTKAFCDFSSIPCVGISSLTSLAYNVLENIKDNDVVCSIIDCKNNNCYFALYEKKNETFEILIEPQAESVNSCLAILKSYCEDTLANSSIYFVGNGSEIYKDEIKSTFSEAEFFSHEFNILNSISLGIAGFEKSKLGVNSEEILPLYLKKPQAQRQLEEREHK